MRIVLLMTVLALGACSQPPAQSGAEVAHDSLGAIPRTTSNGGAEQWTLQPLFRVGTLDDAPDSFGRIRSVVLDDDGTLYVADVVSRHIVVFDSAGTYLRTSSVSASRLRRAPCVHNAPVSSFQPGFYAPQRSRYVITHSVSPFSRRTSRDSCWGQTNSLPRNRARPVIHWNGNWGPAPQRHVRHSPR